MDNIFTTKIWNPSELSYVYLLIGAVLAGTMLCLFPYFLRKYNQYMKIVRFRDEMGAMELQSEDSNILWDLVHRYTLNEPVKILYSLPLFDELAQKEMMRVLSNPYSSGAKMRYIDHLYGLRHKMYFEGLHIDA